MKTVFFSALLLFLSSSLLAQLKINYASSDYIAIADSKSFVFNNDTITFGGISGITQGDEPDSYYLINDKQTPYPGYFKALITFNNLKAELKIIDFIPFYDSNIEGEAIRMIPGTNNHLLISNENDTKTSICLLDNTNTATIISELTEYAANMQFNSGYEGIAVNVEKNLFFTALERPLPLPNENAGGFSRSYICPVIETSYHRPYKIQKVYGYPLQRKKQDNGISDLLMTSDSTMLVLERAWLKQKRKNIVRIFSVNINNTLATNNNKVSLYDISEILKPSVLFNFDKPVKLGNQKVKPGNIEGMCFSHDKKYLLLITDNNYGNRNHTPTEIYILRIAE